MRREIARGISFPFRFGPKGRVAVSKADFYDHAKIQENIKQIILTSMGERVIEVEFGSRIKELVFQGYTPALDNVIKNYLVQAIERWEPRVSVENIDVHTVNGIIRIQLNYNLSESQQTDTVEVEVGGVNIG